MTAVSKYHERKERERMTAQAKRFLLTGGRSTSTLDLARQLHTVGHQVFTADTTRCHICYLSNAISKNFVIPSPRFEPEAFIEVLLNIVTREEIDMVIPTYEEVIYISRHLEKFPKSCSVFSDAFEKLHNLHNKWLFYCRQQAHGIKAPKTVLIKCEEELKDLSFSKSYILKASYSRSSQSILKVNPELKTLPSLKIEPRNPWIAQEWLEGKKFCTYSVCQEGVLKAHTTYPVQFSIEGNSCLNFKSIEHPGILDWVTKFVALEKYTGQVGFDFFELPDGQIYAIECNPRATNGLLLFQSSDRLDRAFLNDSNTVIHPVQGNCKQIAFGMLLYGMKTAYKEKQLSTFFRTLFSTKDVVLNLKDLKPFFFQPFVFSVYIYQVFKWRLNLPSYFTYDFNWDGES